MAKLVRTGGAGSMRRTKKVVHRTSAADDQKLQTALKKLGVSPIGDIEEVNLILTNGLVIHFAHPKVQVREVPPLLRSFFLPDLLFTGALVAPKDIEARFL